MSDPVSALNGASFQGFAAIHEIGPLGMITLRAKGVKALDKAIKAVTGTKVPAQRRIEVNGDRIYQGIERNAWGRPITYFVLKRHPSEGMSAVYGSGDVKAIPADRVLHLALLDRIGQMPAAVEA